MERNELMHIVEGERAIMETTKKTLEKHWESIKRWFDTYADQDTNLESEDRRIDWLPHHSVYRHAPSSPWGIRGGMESHRRVGCRQLLRAPNVCDHGILSSLFFS